MEKTNSSTSAKVTQLGRVVIRFAGDSGDGIQIIGGLFSTETALAGADLATLPNFPAEIRAPAGTTYGVSSYQIQFGSQEIFTPGDRLDALIAFNPAALKVHLSDLKPGGILIINKDNFVPRDIEKAGYKTNPLDDTSLASNYRLVLLDISTQVKRTLEKTELSAKDKERTKNFWALGLISWLYHRPLAPSINWIEQKFAKKPHLAQANIETLKAGFFFGETTELIHESFDILPAKLEPGLYRSITGNAALAYGLLAAAEKTQKPLIYATYPITPASDILHELSKYGQFKVRTLQMEDEIAAMNAAIGAAYTGTLGITATSGPGLALKSEALNLAVMTELPVVVINVQRTGPSTGMPTKTEQADLMQVLYGRNGESPVVVISAATPSDAFICAYEAVRIAIKYMVPVIVLSDGYIANGSEPWQIPNLNTLKPIEIKHATAQADQPFLPYVRNEQTLARPWALPGEPGLEHRIGGLEKADKTGHVSYDPENHQIMTNLRAQKVERVQAEIPRLEVFGQERGGLLVLGWGSTFGTIRAAVKTKRDTGLAVSHLHLRFISPLPADLGDLLKRYDRVLIPEINMGQLRQVIRAQYLIDAQGFNRVRGLPLMQEELETAIDQQLEMMK